jgi:hypothetical protein
MVTAKSATPGVQRFERKVARPEGDTSNLQDKILEELASWDTELKRINSPALPPNKGGKP